MVNELWQKRLLRTERLYDDGLFQKNGAKKLLIYLKKKIQVITMDIKEVDNPRKSFTELDIEGKDEWIDVKETFLRACQQNFLNTL